jgi:hypothetical protein
VECRWWGLVGGGLVTGDAVLNKDQSYSPRTPVSSHGRKLL